MKGGGALSSLLVPQQYWVFVCFLFDKGTCYLTLKINRHVISNDLLGCCPGPGVSSHEDQWIIFIKREEPNLAVRFLAFEGDQKLLSS